jgi:hypothetical protein
MTTPKMDPPLHRQIDEMERRLAVHRGQLGTDLRGVVRKVRRGLVAPGAILTAVAVGVVIEQNSRPRTWSLAPMLQGLGVASRLVTTVGALVKSLNAVADG